jgi:hypothetical protein
VRRTLLQAKAAAGPLEAGRMARHARSGSGEGRLARPRSGEVGEELPDVSESVG